MERGRQDAKPGGKQNDCIRRYVGKPMVGMSRNTRVPVGSSTYRGHVFAGELIRCVRDEQTRLADGTVSNHDALDGLHGGGIGGGWKPEQESLTGEGRNGALSHC